jgi:hypothetical protein
VRIVDAENPDTLLDPEVQDAFQFQPQCTPIGRFEIEGDNVLVFLGRILRMLNRAVGASSKPLRMRADVRVIGCTLERDVERDLDTVGGCRPDQSPVVERSSAGRIALDSSAAPMAHGPDMPSAATELLAPCVASPDRMNRRQIQR